MFTTKPTDLIKFSDKHNFKEVVLDYPDPVHVDYYAAWCPSCKQLGPI